MSAPSTTNQTATVDGVENVAIKNASYNNALNVGTTFRPNTTGVYIFKSTPKNDDGMNTSAKAGVKVPAESDTYELFTGFYYNSETQKYYNLETYVDNTTAAGGATTYKDTKVVYTPYVNSITIDASTGAVTTTNVKVLTSKTATANVETTKPGTFSTNADTFYYDYSDIGTGAGKENKVILVKFHDKDAAVGATDSTVFTINMGDSWNAGTDNDDVVPFWAYVANANAFYTTDDIEPGKAT